MLHHNDVISLAALLLENEKFRRLMMARFPILFIDEYQDTEKTLVDAIKAHLMTPGQGPLFGLFGDSWQKIYGTGCGSWEHPSLEVIGKQANFRSVATVVNALNNIRSELPQFPKDPTSVGSINIFHTNSWTMGRRTESQWKDDLPSDGARQALELAKRDLTASGWDFASNGTKILMLTHKVLAGEQGYGDLADVFDYTESYIKKEDPHIAYFFDIIEPLCAAYQNRRYGDMLAILSERAGLIRTHAEKVQWRQEMDVLLELRRTSNIGIVLDYLKNVAIVLPMPRSLKKIDDERMQRDSEPSDDESSASKRLRAMRSIPYSEVVAAERFVDGSTPFSTKHGVKGAEFENVLVVFGRGWNLYNFNQFLEWAPIPPAAKADSYDRNRNLFYVACSRSKRRLALLFTQKLSSDALEQLSNWFGNDAMSAIRQE